MACITLTPRWLSNLYQEIAKQNFDISPTVIKLANTNKNFFNTKHPEISLEHTIEILKTPNFPLAVGILCKAHFENLPKHIKERIHQWTWILHGKPNISPQEYGKIHYLKDMHILGLCYQLAYLIDSPEIRFFEYVVSLFHGYDAPCINLPKVLLDVKKVELALHLAFNHRMPRLMYNPSISNFLKKIKLSDCSAEEIKVICSQASALLMEEEKLQIKRDFPARRPIGTATFHAGQWEILDRMQLPPCFKDEEIVEIHPVLETRFKKFSTDFEQALPIKFTRHQKAIILQQGLRSCTWAASAMLIADAKGIEKIDPNLLYNSFGNKETILYNLEAADLKASCLDLKTDNSIVALMHVEKMVNSHGSLILEIWDHGGVEAHTLVIDALHQENVLLRDPFHGWQITVKKEALLSRLLTFIIYLEPKDSSCHLS
jgi:hypothetical protein